MTIKAKLVSEHADFNDFVDLKQRDCEVCVAPVRGDNMKVGGYIWQIIVVTHCFDEDGTPYLELYLNNPH